MNYQGSKWKKFRQKILRRDCYICQYSKRYGRIIQANTVHHIFPVEFYPEYAFEPWNCISLCASAHGMMHDKDTHELTSTGKALMHRIARERRIRIKKHMVYIVIGLPGTGKTTYVQHHITDDALVYDLDAIAGAFRLSAPHEEYNTPARRMANDLLRGFVRKAGDYASTLYVIRTAPSIEELEEINPDAIIYMTRTYVTRKMTDRDGAEARISEVIRWAAEHDVEVRYRR